MKTENESINDRIRQITERENYSIGTLARKCGLPDATIRSIVNSTRKPGSEIIEKIVKAVNQPWCDANWLVMGIERQYDPNDPVARLQNIVERQQITIDEQQKTIARLTDHLMSAKGE